jgi:thymidine phosphorylase
LGLEVVQLGGGRRRTEDEVDLRVGLADVVPPGHAVQRGQPLLWVHAASDEAADAALARLALLVRVDAVAQAQPVEPGPVICARVGEEA